MKYERFEDLPVWQTAVEMGVKVYRLTEDRFFHQPGDLQDQLRRSSLSVSQNIAEGFERGSTAELLAFLYIARLGWRDTLGTAFHVAVPGGGAFEISNLGLQGPGGIVLAADSGVGG